MQNSVEQASFFEPCNDTFITLNDAIKDAILLAFKHEYKDVTGDTLDYVRDDGTAKCEIAYDFLYECLAALGKIDGDKFIRAAHEASQRY